MKHFCRIVLTRETVAKRLCLGAPGMVALALLAMAAPSYASTIANIQTGVSSFQLTSDTTGEFTGTLPAAAPVVTTLGNSWVTIAGTHWIGPNVDESSTTLGSCCGGTDTYVTTFSLSGFQTSTAAITGTFTADDTVVIELNGHTIYDATPANMWTLFVTLPSVPAADFVSGVNTLQFVVTNSGNGATGLDASLLVTADPSIASTPESGLIVPLGLALLAGGMVMLRRRAMFGAAD